MVKLQVIEGWQECMIRFGVLGQLVVYRDGAEVALRAAMQRRLLAVLLSRPGEQISADVIADQLWAGGPPRTARKGVQVYVHQLRRLLGDDSRIQHLAGGYRLVVEDGELDSAEFIAGLRSARKALDAGDPAAAIAHWDKALTLWRGPEAFAGIDDLPLVLTERSRLVGRRWEAVADKVSAELRLGRHRGVIAELAGLLAEHPYQERLQGLNMLALYRDGRQADALEAFRTLRERLIADLGIEPMEELRRLHARILNHDPALDLPDRSVPVPYQLLPRGIKEFMGRGEVLAQLDKLATTAGSVIVAMAGTAGVGKTTLAIHWARRAAASFPDGQLYLNLRGFDASGAVMTPAEALRSLLEAMRIPAEQIPRDLQARAALYRGLLAGRRMLVLLDNARDAEQVRPLLPGSPDCLVLVTSRNQLTGLVASDGAFPLQLDFMDRAEAAQLLAARLGEDRLRAEPAASAEIIAQCAGLPLALALVAARAATQPHRRLAEFADELRATQGSLHAFTNPDDQFTDVRAVFTWSYEALSEGAARLFRLLGLHPGPDVSAAAAASIAGHPVRAELAELVEAHLLMSSAPDRYFYHDLLRAYANECALTSHAEEQNAQATRRMLDHYAHTSHAADRIFAPARDAVTLPEPEPGTAPEPITDALAWFTAEHRVLLRMVRHAAAVGHDRTVGRLSWALVSYLNRRGHWHDWVELQKLALDASARLGDVAGQALATMNLARAYTRLATFDLAEPHYLRARELYEQLGDETGLGHVHLNLGWMCDQQGGRFPEALDYAIRARRHYLAAGHRVGQANALNSAGWYQAQLGRYAEAVTHCGEALALQQIIGDRRAQANTLDSLGFAHHHLGNLAEAIRCYEQALVIQREVGERYQRADTLVHLAETLSTAGRHAEARAALEDALAICEEIDHTDTAKISAMLDALPE